jgi:hypothetical protein
MLLQLPFIDEKKRVLPGQDDGIAFVVSQVSNCKDLGHPILFGNGRKTKARTTAGPSTRLAAWRPNLAQDDSVFILVLSR